MASSTSAAGHNSNPFTGGADPNGWVRNPPSAFVRIVGTSREGLNGRLAIVMRYDPDRSRYIVQLAGKNPAQTGSAGSGASSSGPGVTATTATDPVSLKPENLQQATWWEQNLAGPAMLLHQDRQIQRQVQQLQQSVERATGLTVTQVGLLIAGIVILSCIAIGFIKTSMIVSMVLLLLTIVAPDLMVESAGRQQQQQYWKTVVRNLPRRTREMIRTQVPVIGPRIAQHRWLTAAVVGLILVVFVKALLVPSGGRTITAAETDWGTTSSSEDLSNQMAGTAVITMEQKQYYYHMGYEDAVAGRDREFSLTNENADAAPWIQRQRRAAVDDEDDPTYSDTLPTTSTASNWSTLSSAMSVVYVAKAILDLCHDPVTKRYKLRYIKRNLPRMEPWKMGLLGLGLYRLLQSGSGLLRTFAFMPK